MGRKLDALLGRKFKTSKFTATVNLAVSRLTVLKNQRQARLTVDRSDVIQLLNLNHHEQALLRVDQVIKEQNMLDVFAMLDGYCHLLLQMVNLIEKEKDCPDELKEAVSSLLFAAPRCGEFPELQEIRAILTARYGKEFAQGVSDLRSNCGVNRRMIQKLAPRQSDLETRMKVLQEIATENGIVLKLEDSSPALKEGDSGSTSNVIENNSTILDDEFVEALSFSESRNGKKKYRDVEDAAQAAFESAAYAAAAARAAVELSRSRSFGSDNPDSPNSRPKKIHDSNAEKSKLETKNKKTHESEYEGETSKKNAVDGSDSDGYTPMQKTTVFDESDNEMENETSVFSSPKPMEVDHEYNESQFDQALKMEQGVPQLDLNKTPISVRTKRVYVR